MAHWWHISYLTLRPPPPPWLDCEYGRELPKRFSEIVPSCLSKFAFAWIINLSQEWWRRQDFCLCFPCVCATGVIGIILLHNTRVFSGIWVFASCSRGHSLSVWFQGMLAVRQTEKSPFFKTADQRKCCCVIFFSQAKISNLVVLLIVYSSCLKKKWFMKKNKCAATSTLNVCATKR